MGSSIHPRDVEIVFVHKKKKDNKYKIKLKKTRVSGFQGKDHNQSPVRIANLNAQWRI